MYKIIIEDRTSHMPDLTTSDCCCTFCVSLAVHLLPGDPGSIGQGLQVVPRLHVDDAVEIVLRWRAKNGCKERREQETYQKFERVKDYNTGCVMNECRENAKC